jgi:MoaA/NifB/PqqE/SkfB family radical SAM enzyme
MSIISTINVDNHPTYCKLAELSLNFDMSGMISPCNLTNYWLQDTKDARHFNLLTDDIKDIWNSEYRKKLLEDHKNGVRNTTCKLCWDHEDAEIESTRQRFNRLLKDVTVLESQPRIMIIKPGNLCNNACRSCNAHTSSMWYKDDYALDNQGKTFREYLEFFQRHRTAYTDNKLLEKRFAEWEDKIIFWDMYGGEPLIIPLFYKLLDQAVASATVKEKIFNIHTNGMTYIKELVKKLSLFKSSHIGFSIDALGEKNDYIRKGSQWTKIIENLKKYMDDCRPYKNISISVRTTFTPWNIFYYDEIHNYFKNMNILASGVWCNDQPWNDVRYLPAKIKDAIIEKLSLYNCNDKEWSEKLNDLKKWLFTRPVNYENLQNSFIEFNTKLDNVRKEKFDTVFPEYARLFK